MGSNKIKTVDMSVDDVKTPKQQQNERVNQALKAASGESQTKPRRNKKRSQSYVKARSQVDRTMAYTLDKAIGLVKRVSKPKHRTITADINTREQGINIEMSLPHATGKKVKVAIATEEVLAQIEDGNLDFDVLLAKPEMMSKIAKHARVLGPRGLMPNPKNNTVTQDPEKRKKELEAGSFQIKTEKKAPLIHVQVGELSQPDDEIAANIQALVKRIGWTRISKLTLSSTMSPGIRVDLQSIKEA